MGDFVRYTWDPKRAALCSDRPRDALQAETSKQAPEPVAKRPVNFEVESNGNFRLPCDRAVWSTIISRSHSLHSLALGGEHGRTTDKLALAFGKLVETAEVRGDILDKSLNRRAVALRPSTIGSSVLPLPTRERASGLRRASFGISTLRFSALCTV
jgi:hypothetical protein